MSRENRTQPRDWLRSFTVMRDSDTMLCNVWHDGGSICTQSDRAIQINRRLGDGCSHRSVADYRDAALAHLAECHPKEAAEVEVQ